MLVIVTDIRHSQLKIAKPLNISLNCKCNVHLHSFPGQIIPGLIEVPSVPISDPRTRNLYCWHMSLKN